MINFLFMIFLIFTLFIFLKCNIYSTNDFSYFYCYSNHFSSRYYYYNYSNCNFFTCVINAIKDSISTIFLTVPCYLIFLFKLFFLPNIKIICYERELQNENEELFEKKYEINNKNLRFELTLLNEKQIVKKINKKLKYTYLKEEDFDKYFSIFDKKIYKKIKKANNNKLTIINFLNKINNYIELEDINKLIEENKELKDFYKFIEKRYKLHKKEQSEQEMSEISDIDNNKNKQINNNQLDKLCNAINNIKS